MIGWITAPGDTLSACGDSLVVKPTAAELCAREGALGGIRDAARSQPVNSAAADSVSMVARRIVGILG